jgi:hypothetical protein
VGAATSYREAALHFLSERAGTDARGWGGGVCTATHFVSHSRREQFGLMVDGLERYESTYADDGEDNFYWIDIFCSAEVRPFRP